jgi:glycosyltransferase involved in cell wall biosynthesis
MDAPTYAVVIPAYDAERTLGLVLDGLAAQDPAPAEVIVVDDGSRDRTVAIAEERGACVVRTDHQGYAGGARNRGWDEATADVVVFVDADVVPDPGWGAGLVRALVEFPGAIVGCARTFAPATEWQWVSHLQVETPYLPRGVPRDVPFVSSYCMAVPRGAPLRWDESYGGEDALFCLDAANAGIRMVFDPRFTARHHHGRETFADVRRAQDRAAYGSRRMGPATREGLSKRVFARVPVQYFALARLPVIYRRLDEDRELRDAFRRNLPRLVLAEWSFGVAATKHALRPRPPLRGQGGPGYR